MSFVYFSWIIPILIIAFSFCYLFSSQEKRLNQWIEDHWFFKQSMKSKWSNFAFLLGTILLLLSMADLRGPAKNIKTEVPLQKTAILIDVSLSMLVEDIRPNRLEKAIQVARHFIRRSFGHSVSIMIFSDNLKQLVPFTEDIDLLDARLNSLKKLDLNRGGSSIKKAMQEALVYFANDTSAINKKPHGNIIIISDSDETYPEFNLDIPKSISIAYIGIGTSKGGRIPLRNKSGVLRGYKKYKGKDVISKIKEKEIKKWEDKVGNFYYWILSSYSIPTEEILDFLDKTHHSKFMQGESLIRPVLMEYLVIPSLILLITSFLLRLGFKYTFSFILIFLLSIDSYAYAQSGVTSPSKSSEEISLEEDPIYLKFKSGNSSKRERLKLAEKYLKNDSAEKALEIYKENISESNIKDKNYSESVINYGTSLMKNGHIKEGIYLLNEHKENIEDKKIKKIINENILALLKEQRNKQKQQKGKNQKQNQKEQQQSSENDQDKEENQKNEQSSSQPQNNDLQKGPQNTNKKPKKVELPALLKQLVDKDKKLQEKMLDTKTRSKTPSLEQKDW